MDELPGEHERFPRPLWGTCSQCRESPFPSQWDQILAFRHPSKGCTGPLGAFKHLRHSFHLLAPGALGALPVS